MEPQTVQFMGLRIDVGADARSVMIEPLGERLVTFG
jgi:hypothetical protein